MGGVLGVFFGSASASQHLPIMRPLQAGVRVMPFFIISEKKKVCGL